MCTKNMVKVAIRVPGAKRGTRKTDVLEFRTFYGVLQAMARELRGRGVTHVVMEASGVYTDPVYYAIPAAAGNHPGHQPGTTQARHLTGQGQLPCAHKGPNFVSVTTPPADTGPRQYQPDRLKL